MDECMGIFKFAQARSKLKQQWLKTEGDYIYQMLSSAEEEEEVKLVLCQSSHSRSENLNELIKLHRLRQRYQLVDKFFNNSYIFIENRLLPNQLYYQYDILRCYLQDLSLTYFKNIQFDESVRLQYVLRRLNFTLNGEHYNFKQFLIQNRYYQDMRALFREQYLQGLEIYLNQTKVIGLRNSLNLCITIKYIYSLHFQNHQIADLLQQINNLYLEMKAKMYIQQEKQQIWHERQTRTKSAHHSEKSRCQKLVEQSQENDVFLEKELEKKEQMREQDTDSGVTFCFEDLLYYQEIGLKIIQTNLQNYYFENQINDENTSEQQLVKLRYLHEINKQVLSNLNALIQLNHQNRTIIKKIKKNIKIQQQTGKKCIVNKISSNLKQQFGNTLYFGDYHSNQAKMQRIHDADFMEKTLSTIINKLKVRQIADSLEKIYQIQRNQQGNSKKCGNLLFVASLQKGLGVNQVVLEQQDFLALNQMRQQSMLTSYLTPMKSHYSHISHNVFTYACLALGQFPYQKEYNNNHQVMKNLKNKISRHRTFGTTQLKEQYQELFKVCHNCKTLCPKHFLKQCRKRIRSEKEWNESNYQSNDDDSLYIEKSFRNSRYASSVNECEKYYCIYCIKNHFNGKLFNQKGQCPYCLDSCHCNTCLRDKMLKKLTDLYYQVGGDPSKMKTYRQMIQTLRVKTEQEQNEPHIQSQSCYMDFDDKVYETVIKKQINKGFSAEQIQSELYQQKEIASLVLKRQNLKLKLIQSQHRLFRQKINNFNISFKSIDEEAEIEKKQIEEQKREQRQRQRQQYLQKMQSKLRRSKRSARDDQRRKKQRFNRDEQIYYDYYRFQNSGSSDEDSSSFHINLNKSRQKKYEPHYTF